jgi:hypothetical protein
MTYVYQGPVPETPNAESTAEKWNAWWNYQTALYRQFDLQERILVRQVQERMATATESPMPTTPTSRRQKVEALAAAFKEANPEMSDLLAISKAQMFFKRFDIAYTE